MNSAVFSIPVEQPFRLDLTVWVLRRRTKNLVDHWDGERYGRILAVDGKPVRLVAWQKAELLRVELESDAELKSGQIGVIRETIVKMLGLAVDIRPFYALAARDSSLRPIARQFEGVRPTRYPSLFEALVNAVACQQVSLDAGIAILNRLATAYGLPFSDGEDVQYAFPQPEGLLDVSDEAFRALGFSHQKARTIRGIAYSIANDDLRPERLEAATDVQAFAELQALHGIGRWSAEYVLLRGLGRLGIFPGDDIGGQNNIQDMLGLPARPDYAQVQDIVRSWQPYAGFVYFHLLLGKLHARGRL